MSEHSGKWAEPGSVIWAFKKLRGGWEASFLQEISDEDKERLGNLVDALTEHEDIQTIYTNTQ